MMILMKKKPYDYDDDTDDDNDHKNDSFTAAGAAPGASVPCSGFRLLVRSCPASGLVWSFWMGGW